MGSSWLGNILEGLVTEISSEAAYSRYYGSIPKSTYDAVVAGRPNVDKTVQFILNSLRDGDMSEEEAVRLSKGLVSADNTTRQVILNRFRGGEYSNALEMLYDMESYDAEASKSALIKNGYVVIARSGMWVLTCTTTYEANHKYFGGTQWCTASDRLGRYDGYSMFCNYTNDACLIQLSCGDASHPFPEYQFVVYTNGKFGTICNAGNNVVSVDNFIMSVSDYWNDLPEIITQASNKMVAATEQMKPIEKKYQQIRDEYIARRRNIEKAKKEKRRQELVVQCRAMNETENSKWKKAVEKRIASGAYKDRKFIKSVINEFTIDDHDMVVKNDYFRVRDIKMFGDYTVMMICPCVGWWYIVDDYGDELNITKQDMFDIFFIYRRIISDNTWLFYAIAETKTKNVVYVTDISDTETPSVDECMSNIPDPARNSIYTKFIRIPSFTSDSDAILSIDDMKFHLIGKMNVDYCMQLDDVNIFYSLKNHIIKCFDKTWNLVDEIEFDDIIFSTDNGAVSVKDDEMNLFGINGNFEHKVFRLNFDVENMDIRTLLVAGGKYFVGVRFMNGYRETGQNIISTETGDLIFGDNQMAVNILNDNIFGLDSYKIIKYNPNNGTYFIRINPDEEIPCDKYGNRIDTRS